MFDAIGTKRQCSDAVAGTSSEETDRGHGCEREITLFASGCPERKAGRTVDDDPGLQLPVSYRIPDVGHRRTGREVPVHATDVVAGKVLPALSGFAPLTGNQPLIVALQQAVEAAGDEELELAQDLLWSPIAN
jgi:hypothetical protein